MIINILWNSIHIHHERIDDPVYPIRLQGKFAYWKSIEPTNNKLNEMIGIIKPAIHHPLNKWWTNKLVKLPKLRLGS